MAVIHDYFIDAYPEYILKPPSDSDSAFSLTRIWIDEEFLFLTNYLPSAIRILQD